MHAIELVRQELLYQDVKRFIVNVRLADLLLVTAEEDEDDPADSHQD